MYVVTIHNGNGSALEGATPIYAGTVQWESDAVAAVEGINQELQSRYPHDDSWAQWSKADEAATVPRLISRAMAAYDKQFGE